MGLFRALNLLQAVEGQAVLGPALETTLTSTPSRSAEFGAMLSTRHMARRMATNPITMAAITASDEAIRVVFEQTSVYNFAAIEKIAEHQSAMAATSVNLAALGAVVDNAVAWSYFSVSEYYEENIVNTLATIIGLDPAGFDTLAAMISDASTMLAISLSARAMKALVVSPPAMTLVTQSGPAMSDIAGNTAAMTIVANNNQSMALIARSQTALNEVTDEARALVIGVPSALTILANYRPAWTFILGSSTTLATNIYPLLIVLGGLDSTIFGSVADIFADTAATTAVANSTPAMMAILAEPTALATMIDSDNLATVLGSLVAITEITGSETVMNTLIGDPVAFPILLDSSAAKATIFASSTLVTTMMTAGSASLASVTSLAQSATIVNDAAIGTFKTSGITGNIIILTGVMGSIVATTLANTFRGDGQDDYSIGLPGTSLSSGPVAINLPFTNMSWDIASIAATAAGNVTITYADFN
jgi:hypothetical protein